MEKTLSKTPTDDTNNCFYVWEAERTHVLVHSPDGSHSWVWAAAEV